MGGACSTYGGRGKVHPGIWWGNLRERDHLEGVGVDGRGDNIKMDLREMGWECMSWTDQAKVIGQVAGT
jgi:hypothetical protein